MDEFSDPFHPDPLVVNVYKSKLNHYVESGRLIYPFHPGPLVVNVYKSKLNHYVESGRLIYRDEYFYEELYLFPVEGTVSLISSCTSSTNGNVRFTTVPLKSLSDQMRISYITISHNYA